MAFASAAGNYCNYEVIYGLEQRANEVWRDVLQNKLEEQVNISSLVGNDTSTIPVGNVLILLKDNYIQSYKKSYCLTCKNQYYTSP